MVRFVSIFYTRFCFNLLQETREDHEDNSAPTPFSEVLDSEGGQTGNYRYPVSPASLLPDRPNMTSIKDSLGQDRPPKVTSPAILRACAERISEMHGVKVNVSSAFRVLIKGVVNFQVFYSLGFSYGQSNSGMEPSERSKVLVASSIVGSSFKPLGIGIIC